MSRIIHSLIPNVNKFDNVCYLKKAFVEKITFIYLLIFVGR